jgi:hypothetical protein
MRNQETEHEKRAREYEQKAKLVLDPWLKERYLVLAKRCRDRKIVPKTASGDARGLDPG